MRIFSLPHVIVGLVVLPCALLGPPIMAVFGTDHPAKLVSVNQRSSSSKGGSSQYWDVTYIDPFDPNHRHLQGTAHEPPIDLLVPPPSDLVEQTAEHFVTIRSVGVGSFQYQEIKGTRPGGGICFGLFILIFTIIWDTVIFGLVAELWIGAWLRRRLYRFGEVAPGRIVGMRITKGKNKTHYLKYLFHSLDGKPASGEVAVSISDFTTARVEQAVTVLYNPRRPKRSLIYDFGDYTCM
jgi:hypothetical protein